MKTTVLLTAVLCILLAGCVLRRKPAKSVVPAAAPKAAVNPAPPPSPPVPLSIPQTRIDLPKAQPVDPAALDIEAAQQPEPPPTAAAPPRSRRANPAANPAVANPPALPAPVVSPPTPEPRETVQEIVPVAEVKRLQEQIQNRRHEVDQILSRLNRRRVTPAERNMEKTIRNFLTLSDEAANHNDLRQADALAERAQILAKELQSGK